jgi:hypothetical protein
MMEGVFGRICLLSVALLCCKCRADSSGLPDTCSPGALSSRCLGGQWRNVGPAYPRMYADAACSERGLFVWGGMVGPGSGDPCAYGCQEGRIFDFASETWSDVVSDGAPGTHNRGAAVWTGTEWLVWGGEVAGSTAPGGRYNPTLARWAPMSSASQPSARTDFAYAWTGSELLVWGGIRYPTSGTSSDMLGDGGAYDPEQDSWRSISSANALTPRWAPISVWTGTVWLVWGGGGEELGTYYRDGAVYDPVDDSWHAMGLAQAPDNPAWGGAVWTDGKGFFWGSDGDQNAGQGPGTAGVYDPESDAWLTVPSTNGPEMGAGPALLWTGTHVIALGRRTVKDSSGGYLDVPHGRAFSLAENRWLAVASGFKARWRPTGCWANGRMYLWGGSIGDGDQVEGTVDIWTPPGEADSGAP